MCILHRCTPAQDVDAIMARMAAATKGAKAPGHVVIVGAGFIGLEAAESFALRGLAVTVVEFQDRVLPLMEADMSAPILRELHTHGVRVVLKDKAVSLDAVSGGGVGVKLAGCVPRPRAGVALGSRSGAALRPCVAARVRQRMRPSACARRGGGLAFAQL